MTATSAPAAATVTGADAGTVTTPAATVTGAAHGIPAGAAAPGARAARGTAPAAGPVPLLAVAHGTRDARGMAVVRALLARVGALRPGLPVRLACVGLARPTLAEALAGLSGDVVVVPLLLGAGHHVRTDIPRALALAPWVRARVCPALGPDPLLADALAGRLAEAEGEGARPGPVVLASAGSAEPAARAAVRTMADLLSERTGRPVVASYVSGEGPAPAEAVSALRAAGHPTVAVARYLLGPGFFARQAARTGGCVLSEPLGAHEAVARLVLRRYDEAGAP